MKNLLLIIAAGAILAGCGNRNANRNQGNDYVYEEDGMYLPDNSRTSLDYTGTYVGVLPCADCEGIDTRITLKDDNTFVKTERYIGRDNERVFETEGTYSWDTNGRIITLNGINEGPWKYLVGENQLHQLDTEGKRIEGPLSDKYILMK